MKRGFWSMSRKVAKIWSHFSAGAPCFDKCKSSAAEALTVSNKIFVTFWLNPYFCGIEVFDCLVIGSSPCILPQASNALCILQYLWSTCERRRCVCCIAIKLLSQYTNLIETNDPEPACPGLPEIAPLQCYSFPKEPRLEIQGTRAVRVCVPWAAENRYHCQLLLTRILKFTGKPPNPAAVIVHSRCC